MLDESTKKNRWRACLAGVALGALGSLANACSSPAVGVGPTQEEEEEQRQSQQLRTAGCTSSVCVRAGLAGCWSGPLESSCRSCENTYGQATAWSFWSGCNKELGAYGACLKTSVFRCGDAGVAVPASCDETGAALETCLGRGRDAGVHD